MKFVQYNAYLIRTVDNDGLVFKHLGISSCLWLNPNVFRLLGMDDICCESPVSVLCYTLGSSQGKLCDPFWKFCGVLVGIFYSFNLIISPLSLKIFFWYFEIAVADLWLMHMKTLHGSIDVTSQYLNAGDRVFCFLGVNTMPADALAPKGARSSAGMVLAAYDKQHVLLLQR